MELSITAVTGNRHFSKTMVRHARLLKAIKQAVADLDLPTCPFEILQIVFVDRDSADHVQAMGAKGGRLFQVEVAVPSVDAVNYDSGSELVRYVADRAKAAARVCGLSEEALLRLGEGIDDAARVR